MNRTAQLRKIGQSLWLDNITRDLLTSGTLERYIADLSVTGLTSNPSIYDKAIGGTSAYDESIQRLAAAGSDRESIFFELALDDLSRAADLFLPINQRTSGVDGFVSLEVSPLLANDAATTVSEARRLHGRAGRPNLFIKIPGTAAGLEAIEATVFAGVPVNVTLLFSVRAVSCRGRGLHQGDRAPRGGRAGSVCRLGCFRFREPLGRSARRRLAP